MKSFIIPCHHPIVHKTHRHLWTLLVRNVGLTPKTLLVGSDSDDIIAILQRTLESGSEKIGSVEISVRTLVAVYPDVLVPKLVNIFVSKIDRNEIQISENDFEVFLTPDGVVHDKSVIETLQQQAANEGKNVRRENKAYSYKEQVKQLTILKYSCSYHNSKLNRSTLLFFLHKLAQPFFTYNTKVHNHRNKLVKRLLSQSQ